MSEKLLKELDVLLSTQAGLQFARNKYDPDQAEKYGIALLDFMRIHGVELRSLVANHCADGEPK